MKDFKEFLNENKGIKVDKKSQLKAGEKVETEHKDTYGKIASHLEKHKKLPPKDMVYKWIATDHIKEIKDYYTRLAKLEKAASVKD